MLTVNKSRWYYLTTMNRSGILYAFIMLLFLSTATGVSATSIVSSEEELQQSVIALDRVRRHAIYDLEEKKQNAALEEKQVEDYEKFIIFLTVKIDEYCQQLKVKFGEDAVEKLPCSEEGQTLVDIPADQVHTSREQIEELERLLAESLEQFDDKLLKEDERLSERQPRDRESGYSYGGSQGQGGDGGAAGTGQAPGQSSEGQTAGTSQASGQGERSGQTTGSEGAAGQGSQGGETDGNRTAEGRGGSATGSGADGVGASGQGEDSGEGAGLSAPGSGAGQSAGSSSDGGKVELDYRDDDVVARQLREAAEKETDPELKKKLWEEYRKYKEGVR